MHAKRDLTPTLGHVNRLKRRMNMRFSSSSSLSPHRFTRAALFMLTAASCLALTAVTASAQNVSVSESSSDTPISGSFELKLGGYYPSRIDEDLAASGQEGAFEKFYGTDNLLYGELVVERYLFQRFGKFGVGAHIGIARRKGEVQVVDGATDEEMSDVPGETNFRLVPLRASLFYKYDYSAIHHNVPLVPFVRAGLDYHLWRVADGDGETSTSSDEAVSKGARSGWHASLGLQILLDFIDPATAASFDLSWGVNNSYLFGEYMISRIDSFGAAGLDLSDEQWLFGLAFEF